MILSENAERGLKHCLALTNKPKGLSGLWFAWTFDPLHNDAHCAALEKSFQIQVEPPWSNPHGSWFAWRPFPDGTRLRFGSEERNTAVCRCAAQFGLWLLEHPEIAKGKESSRG